MSATLTAGGNALTLQVTNPGRDDLVGMIVWCSTTNGFTPGPATQVYNGADLTLQIIGLAAGTAHYVRYALQSEIDPTDYDVLAQLTATPVASAAPGATVGATVGVNLADSAGAALGEYQVLNNTDNLIMAPQGGILVTQTQLLTGALKIKLPQLWTNTMLRFSVDIYEYSTGLMCTIEIGGYNYQNGNWFNVSAKILGGSNVEYPVYFGHDGTKCCIWVGIPTETWAYPQVRVHDVFLGYSNVSRTLWETGWALSFDPTVLTPGTGANQYSASVLDTLPGSDWSKSSKRPANLSALTGSESIQNNAITLSAAGTLSGAGGGTVTLPGMGLKTFRVASFGLSATTAPISAGLYNATTGEMITGQGAMYTVVKISRATGVVTFVGNYNTLAGGANPGNMAEALNAIGSDYIVAVYSYDEPKNNRLTGGLAEAMYRHGASKSVFGSANFMYRGAYVLVGIGACGEGNGAEVYQGAVFADPNAWVDMSFSVINGNLTGVSTSSTPKSLSDYGYVGALDATAGATWGINVSSVPTNLSTASAAPSVSVLNNAIALAADGTLTGGGASAQVSLTSIPGTLQTTHLGAFTMAASSSITAGTSGNGVVLDATNKRISIFSTGVERIRLGYGVGVGAAYGLQVKSSTGKVLQDTADGVLMRGDVTQDNYSIGDSSTGGVDATFGTHNIAIGVNALATAGSSKIENVAIGTDTLRYATTAVGNVAAGQYALKKVTVGSGNVATGRSAGMAITTANFNLALGDVALSGALGTLTPVGDGNVALGQQAMQYAAGAACTNNTVAGTGAGANMAGADNAVFGAQAGVNMTGNENTVVGKSAGGTNSGDRNILIGYGAGYALPATARAVVVLGSNDGAGATNGTIILSDGDGNIRATAAASGLWVFKGQIHTGTDSTSSNVSFWNRYRNAGLGTGQYGYYENSMCSESCTSVHYGAYIALRGADGAAAYTTTSIQSLRVNDYLKGVNQTITTQYGIYIPGLLAGVANWGFYQAGSANKNYFAGNLLLGTTTDDGVTQLQIAGGARIDSVRATETTVASAVSTTHALQTGTTTGPNLAFDGSQILARNNGVAAVLTLNQASCTAPAAADNSTRIVSAAWVQSELTAKIAAATFQGAPTAANTTSTLTAAALISQIVTSAPTAAIVLTLPTGTLMSTALPTAKAGESVNWSLINQSAFSCTLAVGTGHSIVAGTLVIAAGASVPFRSVKSATANVYTTYRMG